MSFIQMAATAVAAVAQISNGESQGRAANIQGDLALANAHNTRLATSANEDTQRRGQALELGSLRATAAQSGFDSSTGSLAALQTKTAGEMELDALTNRYKGELQALSFENEAAAMRYRAKSARHSGYVGAFATLAMSAATAFGAPRVGPLAPVETRIPVPSGF